MRKSLWKVVAFLGMAAMLNSGLKLPAIISTVQAKDIQTESLQSYENIGNITIEKQNQTFLQQAENKGLVLWNWKQNKQQSYLMGTRNYWNQKGKLEKTKVKIKLSKKTQKLQYALSFMKENEQGDLYLFLEKKNQHKAMYITAQADGTIKQSGMLDLTVLGKKTRYTLDDMKIVNKNQMAILCSVVNNEEEETKKKILFVNTKNGTASKEKTKIEWNENKSRFLDSSFLWEKNFIYSVQDSKVLILDLEQQNKRIIKIPEEFHNFSICMTENTVFLFDLEKGIYYYDIESSNQWEQMDAAVPKITGNYKVAAITVAKEKDSIYLLLLKEASESEEMTQTQSYQLLKYQLGSTEKVVQTIAGDYKVYSSAQELVTDADWIFTGTVKNITYENVDIGTTKAEETATLLPYTIFEIEVSKVYKGDIKEQTVFIKRLGGISDSILYEVEGASKIEYGNNYLFAAKTYETSYPSFLNMNQGSFNLDTETEDTQHMGITYSEILKAVDN